MCVSRKCCMHPEMDTSPFATSKRIVDGQLMPRIPLALLVFGLLMNNLYFHIYELVCL